MPPPTCPNCGVELSALTSKKLCEAWADDEGLKWAVRVEDGLPWRSLCKDRHKLAWPSDRRVQGPHCEPFNADLDGEGLVWLALLNVAPR